MSKLPAETAQLQASLLAVYYAATKVADELVDINWHTEAEFFYDLATQAELDRNKIIEGIPGPEDED